MNDYEEVSSDDMILPLACIECKNYNRCYYNDAEDTVDEETEV